MRIAEKYEVIKKLGQGAFGDVYLVKQVDLEKLYALKLMKSPSMEQYAHLPGSVQDHLTEKQKSKLERFKREAEVLSKLLHHSSVQLRDFGKTAEGHFYMVMDYCQGISLRDILIKEKALSPQRAIHISLQILQVLQVAHNLGIIHRDLKPENVLIEKDPQGRDLVKVLDFGIAKIKADFVQAQVNITKEGEMLGTPYYMSPEHIKSTKQIDGRADIYSLGLMMYEMLTGELALKGANVTMTLQLQLNQYPSKFRKVAPHLNIPEKIEEIVFKALQKNKEERYSSALEFGEACIQACKSLGYPLEEFLLDFSAAPKEEKKKISSKFPKTSSRIAKAEKESLKKYWILGGTFFLILSGLLFFFISPKQHEDLYSVYLEKAHSALEKDDFKKANEYVAKASEIRKTKEVLSLAARIRKGHYNQLILHAHRSLEKKDYPQAREYASLALSMEETQEAKELLEKSKKTSSPETPTEISKIDPLPPLLAEAEKALRKKDYSKGIALAKEAFHLKKTKESEELYRKTQSIALYLEAMELKKAKKLKEALSKLEEARSLFETEAILYEMAYIEEYLRQGKPPWQEEKHSSADCSKNPNMDYAAHLSMFRGGPELRGVYPQKGSLPLGKNMWEGISLPHPVLSQGVYSTPVVVGDRIYVACLEGKVLALKKDSGELIWFAETEGRIFATPAHAGNLLIVSDENGRIYAFHSNNGILCWQWKGTSQARKNMGIYTSPVVARGVIYYATSHYQVSFNGKLTEYSGMLYAIQCNGKFLWKQKFNGPLKVSPAVEKDGIYVVSSFKNGGYLIHLRLNGEVQGVVHLEDPIYQQESSNIPREYSNPVLYKNRIYVSNFMGMVYCVDENKKLLWKVRRYNFSVSTRSTSFWVSSPAASGGKIYLGGSDGYIYAMDSNTGDEIWKFQTQGQIFSSPSISQGVLYTGSRDGYLYAIEAKTGKALWKIFSGSWVEAPPAIYDGIVYFGNLESQKSPCNLWVVK